MNKVNVLLVVGLWIFAFNSWTISPKKNVLSQKHKYITNKIAYLRLLWVVAGQVYVWNWLFSPLGKVVMTVVYFLLIWGLFLPLKVSETLLKIMDFFTSTSRVAEIYSQANYMSSQTQLQIFPHSSECSKIISFSVPLWPPSANVTEIVSKQ